MPNGAYLLTAKGTMNEVFNPSGFANPIVVNGANQNGKNFVENVFPVSGTISGLAGPNTVTDGFRTVSSVNTAGTWSYTFPKAPPATTALS